MYTITACCVNYYSAKYIRLSQFLLSKLLGGGQRIKWLVIDNTPDDSEKEILAAAPDTTLVESNVREEFSHDKVDKNFSEYSTQHGKALNELVPMIETTYGLIIDPDCFVLRRDWDSILIDALEQHNAQAIGASYHPARQFKYGRDFPMVTFLFFRSRHLLPLKIDFCPGPYPKFQTFPYRNEMLKRLKYGTWKDTGWRVREEFIRRGYQALRFDTPILRPDAQRSRFTSLLAKMVPEKFLDYPRRPYSRPDDGLLAEEKLYSAPGADLYEEHYYMNQLFLIHLRGVSQRKLAFESEEAQFWIRLMFRYLRLDYAEFERTLATLAGHEQQSGNDGIL